MARLCEDKDTCQSLTSIGVRCFNGHQREQARRFRVNCIEARHFPGRGADIETQLKGWIAPSDNVYISLALDVLDPAFAPGVSHPEPGGLTTRQVGAITLTILLLY
jgi:arginase